MSPFKTFHFATLFILSVTRGDLLSKYVHCVNEQGDSPRLLETAGIPGFLVGGRWSSIQCSIPGYTIVSCQAQAISGSEDMIGGAFVYDNVCYAESDCLVCTGGGIRAWARCCNITGNVLYITYSPMEADFI